MQNLLLQRTASSAPIWSRLRARLIVGRRTGLVPVKSEEALRVVTPLFEVPVVDRPNWTIARQRAEIEARGRSHQPVAVVQGVAKKTSAGGRPGTR